MATSLKSEDLIKSCLALAADVIKLPLEHMWIDYDKGADVLYLSFQKPQRAVKTIETDDDILIRKNAANKVVGMTILNASTR